MATGKVWSDALIHPRYQAKTFRSYGVLSRILKSVGDEGSAAEFQGHNTQFKGIHLHGLRAMRKRQQKPPATAAIGYCVRKTPLRLQDSPISVTQASCLHALQARTPALRSCHTGLGTASGNLGGTVPNSEGLIQRLCVAWASGSHFIVWPANIDSTGPWAYDVYDRRPKGGSSGSCH